MRIRPLILALPALVLSACVSMDPRYERPEGAVPPAFPTGAAYGPQADGATSATQVAWRDVVVDDRLRAVIDSALVNNRDLRVAAANVAAAQAQYRVQRSALLPTVGASIDGTIRGGDDVDQTRSYAAGLGVTAWELDLFGRVRSLTRADQESYFASEEGARAARVSLISQTATAWLTLAADRSLLALAQETRDNAKRAMDLTQGRKNAGVASRLDVRAIETTYRRAEADVASYTAAVAQDRNALELLVGAPVDDALLPDGLPQDAGPLAEVQAGVSSAVLLQRPDVLQAEHQLKSTNADVGAARAAFFPTLSLTGNGGVASSALSSLFDGAGAWTFAPSVAMTIFDTGAKGARLGAAKAQRDAAVATYEKTVQTAFREVSDALARRGTIDAQLQAQSDFRTAAADTDRLARARYDAGLDGYLASLEAQRTLYAADQALIGVQLIRYNNLVTLYRVLGGGVR